MTAALMWIEPAAFAACRPVGDSATGRTAVRPYRNDAVAGGAHRRGGGRWTQ
jgi:hypothetical protein